MRRFLFGALLGIVVLCAAVWAYRNVSARPRLGDGEVTSADVPEPDDASPAPARPDAPRSGTDMRLPGNAAATSAAVAPSQNNTASHPLLTDSQSPNAPAGMAFAGTGRFQVYRQGNLTWRINTDDGSTCILFATNEEWRKPIVYNHGCGNS